MKAALLAVLTVAGGLTGLLSVRLLEAFPPLLDDGLYDRPFSWLPGLVYAGLWLAVAHTTRLPIDRRMFAVRSPLWNLVFVVGITLSYTIAFSVSNRTYRWASETLGIDDVMTMGLCGSFGGIFGGLALSCVWAIFFNAFDTWKVRAVTTATSCILGSFLFLWVRAEISGDEDSEARALSYFFAVWQGGMAALFGLITLFRVR